MTEGIDELIDYLMQKDADIMRALEEYDKRPKPPAPAGKTGTKKRKSKKT